MKMMRPLLAVFLGFVFDSTGGTPEMPSLVVTTVSDTVSSDGQTSLREALNYARTLPGADTITFALALSGQTIALSSFTGDPSGNSAFEISGGDAVTVDATALSGGVRIDGGSQNFRLFTVYTGASLTLRGLTLANCEYFAFEDGGAIDNAGTLTLTRCTLSGNKVNGGGGAINNRGTAELAQCTFSDNRGGGVGGAIYSRSDASVSLTHCTLSGNTGGFGGAIYSVGSSVALTNSLIAGNTSTGDGGASADIYSYGTITCVGTNLVQTLFNDTSTGRGIVNGSGTIISANPKLGVLGSYGGPTQTRPLLPGSPALDAGGSTAETLDQRGFARAVDADGNGTAQPDIGAVEQQVTMVTSKEDSGAGTLRDAMGDTSRGPAIIRFDGALSGETIALTTFTDPSGFGNTALVVSGTADITVDASTLSAGLALSDGNATTHRLFLLRNSSQLRLIGLTLKDGGGPDFDAPGGAIWMVDGSTLALTRCALTGNQAGNGGGAIALPGTIPGCTAILTHCTLSGNSTTGVGTFGGAISNGGTLTLTHCTLSGNTASVDGGAIASGTALTLTNCIVAGNMAGSSGKDIRSDNVPITTNGVNFIGITTGSGLTANGTTILSGDAKLSALGSNGGPTQTRALLPGSPARNAASGSTATKDQRGFPIFGTADLGAYEAQLGAIANQFTDEDTSFSGLAFAVGQVGTLSASSSSEALVTNGSIFLEGSGATRTMAVTPQTGANGSASITITDSLTGETQSFLLNVNAVNDTPAFTKGADVSVFVGPSAQEVTGWATDISAGPADESGQALTFNVSNDNNALFAAPPAVAANGALTFTPAAGLRGVATVTVSLSDNGTPVKTSAEQTFIIAVRLENPQTVALFTVGSPVPGRGLPNGPQADATFVSFGAPAIDAAGNVVFIASWTAESGPGKGIFTQTECIARVGQSVGGFPGSSLKTVSDPVIAGGRVAFLATLLNAPAAQSGAVFAKRVGAGALELIARTGDDIGTAAKFKRFKQVAVAGDAVGFLAQLVPGLGSPRVTAANDLGVWVKNGTDAVVSIAREGPNDSGLMTKAVTTFLAGNGSPGQGRGWLRDTAQGPQALLRYTKVTQPGGMGIVSLGIPGLFAGTPVYFFALTNEPQQDGPAINDGVFTSFGVPAANSASTAAFLASIKVGTVQPQKGRGIFAGTSTGKIPVVALVGDPTPAGGDFSVLKDPVLAEDDGIAFAATIKGGTIRGAAMKTIWWRPPGGALTLVAQGGAEPHDLPGARWKSFPSLAIAANRGPIFTATLVPGPGSVTKAGATGVWAMDFSGKLRTLFRTGDQIDLGTPGSPVMKIVKSFTLLNATVGSTGVTRSFNDAAQVVWLATFTDKSTAIVTTDVP